MSVYVAPTILIATLGQEAQVITLVLDELLRRGEPITRAIVIHTDPRLPPIRESLPELRADFERGAYDGKITFVPEVLTDELGPLPDVATEAQVNTAFQAFYQIIRQQKRGGARLHLCIAGGRKTMALFAFAAAQLLFDTGDHIWHVDSDPALRLSRRLHAAPHERVTLINVPFMNWSSLPGALRSLTLAESPQQVIHQQQTHQQQTQAFWAQLSYAEREVLALLLETGLDNKGLGQRLNKSPRTVENQLASIYKKFARFYDLPTAQATRAQVIATLKAG